MRNYVDALTDCPSCGVTVLAQPTGYYVPVDQPMLTTHYSKDWPLPRSGRHSGRFHSVPLENSRVYVEHVCDAAAKARHKRVRNRVLWQLQQLLDDHDPRIDDNAARDARGYLVTTSRELHTLIYAYGLTRACPKCDAQPGQRCENLTERRKRLAHPKLELPTTPTKAPHSDRLDPLELAKNSEVAALRTRHDRAHCEVDRIAVALEAKNSVIRLINIVRAIDNRPQLYVVTDEGEDFHA